MLEQNIDNSLLPDFDDLVLELPTFTPEEPSDEPNLPDDTGVILDDNKSVDTPSPVDSDEQAVLAFKTLVEKGVLPDDEAFEGTWESLESRMEDLPNLVAKSIINNAPELTRKVIEFSYLKDDITVSDLKNFVDSLIDDNTEKTLNYDNIDEVKSYIESSYRKQGLSPRVIKAAITSLEDEDFDGTTLKEEAKTLFEKEKNTSKTDAILESQRQLKASQIEEQKIFINQVSEEIKATGWSDHKVKQVSEVLKNNKVVETIQQAFKNPKALIQLANLATYYDNEKNYFNFEEFVKKGTTTEVEKNKKSILRDSWNNSSSSSNIANINNNKKTEIGINLLPILD